MANYISQVKLPNNTTYIIRDPNARTLDNNDFDTINVTELNAGNLIVTGVGRFTNGLYGNLIGNADTATSAIKATQDESGNNIKSTYASAISISDHTITLKNKNGTSLGTVTVPDNNTTYTIATGTANGKIKVTPSSGSAYEVSVYGLKSAAYKDVVDTYSATGTDPVSGKAVAAAIDALPEPMVFKGSLGTGGTITTLPVDGTAKVGDTYKVITTGTYASKSAKVGDTFICLTKTSSANTWELIPSGDEPAGTVTSVAIANGGGLSVSGSPITSSGTITISHADTSSQASVNNSGRTYIQDITLDTYGHVTGITSATETVVNTDRYVNSAAFADATSADANNPVKMTLTRAGSDTASVTAYIPKVSSSSAGVAPKGTAVSSQSQSTKFLREDGTWATPSYTTDTNTHRPIQVNGTEILGNNTTALNLKAGTNVSLSNSSGTVTITSTDTKNTAGSMDTSSKIYLIGATSQAANPQTYSQDTAYVGTDGCLYSGGSKVLTAHQDISGKADKSATVSTVTWSNNKLTKTINGTTSDVVSASDILDNLTSSQVTTALGYTPGPYYDFESSDDSINISASMVPGRETVDLKLNSVSWNNISGKPSTFAPSTHDHTYLASAGTNTQSTSSTAYALGAFNVRWFTETGKIPHQPSQWGFLLTVATGTNSAENHQIFAEQSNGNLYHRGTNGSSSSNPPAFKTILDSSNYTSYTRNSSGVIKVNSVTKTPTNAGTSLASPKPLIDSGYKFLCWLYVQSNGYIVGANYPGGAANPSATWWFANGYLANYGLTFYYLEIKDTI